MSEGCEQGFQKRFGRNHAASGTAPGRVNLIGEHVDYNGGTVLPMALACRCVAEIAPNKENMLQIAASRYEDMVERSVNEGATGHWSDLVVGSVQKARELGLVDTGLDIYVESTVPGGAGVSSSAAVATAVLRAIMELGGAEVSPVETAMAARAVENDYIGVPCGIMDQMAVGLLQAGEALALNTKDMTTETIGVPQGWEFCVLHSGTHRLLSDGRYQERFAECAEAAKTLGVGHLCDGALDDIKRLPEGLQKRARHVISEHARTCRAIDAMEAGDLDAFGTLMNDSHTSYASDFEASTPIIDKLVDGARGHGAVGARLTGGGFGGCIVCLLPSHQADDWKKTMVEYFPETWLVD